MSFKKYINKKHKILHNIIKDGYDEKCPMPVYNKQNKVIGYGCVICDKAPPYCPFFDLGEECTCDTCDISTNYEPTIMYKTMENLEKHLWTHNLYFGENHKLFIANVINTNIKK